MAGSDEPTRDSGPPRYPRPEVSLPSQEQRIHAPERAAGTTVLVAHGWPFRY